MNVISKFYTRTKEYGLRYVIKVILQNKIYRRLDKVAEAAGRMLFSHIPLKDTIVIESHNDFDCNGGAFYEYLLDNNYNEKYKIVWLLRNRKPVSFPSNVIAFNMFRPSLMKYYHLYTAKAITSDHAIQGNLRDGQKTIFLSHGTIGLKAFKGKIILPVSLGNYLVSSDFMAPIFADQYAQPYPNSRQVVLGYPMHDVFYDRTPDDLHKVTEGIFNKVILWMPTFRKALDFNRDDSGRELPVGIPLIENMESYIKLNTYLKENNVLLIIKIHPMQDLSKIKVKSLSNITVLDGISVKKLGIDNYRLMKGTDALISDYSSVAFDYLHRNKPIAYSMDDAEDYKPSFIVDDPKTLMAGHILYTENDLLDYIRDVIVGNDRYKKEREALFEKVFTYHDGKSCERLKDFLKL